MKQFACIQYKNETVPTQIFLCVKHEQEFPSQ